MLLAWLVFAHAQEVCLPSSDCDLDGFTPIEGDCDDVDELVHPGAGEDCQSDVDDDCDNLVNEGCDRAAQQGTLWGGSTCAGQPGDAGFALILLPVLWGRRRR
jgi:hypothetical protein